MRARSAARRGAAITQRRGRASRVPVWHIYLVRTADGSLYAGITTDVRRRVAEHGEGGPRSARYLRGRGPVQLVFRKRVGSQGLALRVEHRLKALRKGEKEGIVRSKPTLRRLLSRLGLE